MNPVPLNYPRISLTAHLLLPSPSPVLERCPSEYGDHSDAILTQIHLVDSVYCPPSSDSLLRWTILPSLGLLGLRPSLRTHSQSVHGNDGSIQPSIPCFLSSLISSSIMIHPRCSLESLGSIYLFSHIASLHSCGRLVSIPSPSERGCRSLHFCSCRLRSPGMRLAEH